MSRNLLQVTILHTNDMHGRLEAMGRLSSFAKRLKDELQAQGRQVFFWDAGDAADRRLGFCGVTKGAAFVPLMNAMHYDLQVMGNALSLTYGPKAMSAYAERAAFPVLAANVLGADRKLLPGLQSHLLLHLAGSRKLGVIGLTVADFANIYALFDCHLLETIPLVREKAAALRRQGADVVAVLSHMGIKRDRELAGALPELDVIVGGHSHTTLLQGAVLNGVVIAQTGQYAEHLGRVDLTLDVDTGRVLERSAELLKVPRDIVSDPAVQAAVAAAEAEVQTLHFRPLGELQTALAADHFAECGMGNWMADVLRERMDAEAAMVCGGLLHTGLAAGVVTLGDLDAACFTTANPQLSLVSGAQILAALERGLDTERIQAVYPSFRGYARGYSTDQRHAGLV